MLCNLDIKNIAVIENLTFEPGDGMTVLTGETGAGKSVIIDSVNLILGARTNKNLVRYGTDKAKVSALFNVGDELLAILEDNGIEAEDGTVVISRDITADGKSVARINGEMVPVSFLRDISHLLIDIHGQHDNQALLNPSKHIDFLDCYSENDELLEKYAQLYTELRKLQNEYKALSQNEQDRLARIDLLSYQTDELIKADLKVGEKEELTEESVLISNSEKISQGVNEAYSYLYEAEQCAYDGLHSAISRLSQLISYDGQISALYDRLNEASYIIEDAAHELRNYSEKIEFDEERLDIVSERLDLIRRMERKYGGSVENCLEFLENATAELNSLQNSDEKREEILIKTEKLTKEIKKLADELTKKRTESAKKLSFEITKQLHELDMEKAIFEVNVNTTDEIALKGQDTVEFMFTANPGQPLKPLVQIASGGELSRVMLAIKTVLSSSDGVDTLIFDEIDTGVSGSAAQKIAKKLSVLGKTRQVICISHQPQLAAAAKNQFKIEKNVSSDITSTKINLLEKEERILEIARMIDGNEITETAVTHAREMLERGY